MAPPKPRQLMFLYEWFSLISRGRNDVVAISWSEIEAWSRLAQITLEPWEVDIILRLDRVWLTVCREKGHPFEEIQDEYAAAGEPVSSAKRLSIA